MKIYNKVKKYLGDNKNLEEFLLLEKKTRGIDKSKKPVLGWIRRKIK
ncbi:unnamed protein product [marine sediment metagenome]|uniref:Uncharacterized protein n=1 Tax=marine sediment metagenome TaxID=412755 RepID=X1FMA5_9ZZZZ